MKNTLTAKNPHKKIGIAIEQCAGTLPEGWVLGFGMENGSAWVELFDHDGDKVGLPDSADQSLTEQVFEALSLAVEMTT